jgi:membrane-bound serine protease (ClpP class)
VALALPFSAITILLVSLVVRARRNKVVTGPEGMIGETGVAVTSLAPEGKILVRGEYWDALSSAPVAPGEQVRVTAIERLKLTVEPATGRSGGSNG